MALGSALFLIPLSAFTPSRVSARPSNLEEVKAVHALLTHTQSQVISGYQALSQYPQVRKDVVAREQKLFVRSIRRVAERVGSTATTLFADAKVPLKEGSHYFYPGQCTRYVASKYQIAWKGNAGNWLENAKEAGYTVKDDAQPGDIFVSDESRYGHTGIVKSVDYEKGTITVEEMNYKAYGIVSQREISIDSAKLKGFIEPPSTLSESYPPTTEAPVAPQETDQAS